MNIDDFDEAPDMSTYVGPALDYADKLKIARAGLGLSQSKMSALLNIPVSTLQGWEQRRFTPDGAVQALIQLIYDHPKEISTMLKNNLAA